MQLAADAENLSSVSPDEAFLVVRSRAGDRAAYEQLVRRTARLVYARIYLDVGDAHRAEDLAQETFLTAWRSIAQVNAPEGFRSWLLTIAKTVTLDAARRDSRVKRRADRGGAIDAQAMALPDPKQLTPDESAEREEQRRKVREMLQQLPEEYGLPLTLRYIGGADYETISKQLGLTNGSLRGLLNRGMAKLRQMMGG